MENLDLKEPLDLTVIWDLQDQLDHQDPLDQLEIWDLQDLPELKD